VIDQRMNIDLITQVMGVLDRHGYIRGDRQRVAHAVGTIIDLARIYEGTRDHPAGPDLTPEPPGPDGQDAVIVSAGEVKTLLAALDDAAEYKRDRAQTCADCADQSCTTCQWRLQAVRDYDQMAAQMLQAAEVSHAARSYQPEPGSPADPACQPHPAAGKEAGQ
jgi:hypothetical protein